MLGAFRSPVSGMMANQTMLDVIANNLANINTPGFKQNRTLFQDLIYQKMAPTGDFANLVSTSGDPTSQLQDQLGTGVTIAGTPHSFEAGPVMQDNDPLHMAIQGEGFFVVGTADGGAAYTRDGSFSRDALGRLVTKTGDVVLPETRIPADARDFRVDGQGIIYARLGAEDGSEVEVQLGEVQLARFTNPQGLVSVGNNVFLASENSGPALVGYPGDEGYGTIMAGAIEGSNVDTAEQMTQMIMGQRAYAFNARALQTIDEMLNLANNLRR
jgi:flagellar basal-body rod protein FlgG